MAYGSPETADDIRPYLEDIRGGRPVRQGLDQGLQGRLIQMTMTAPAILEIANIEVVYNKTVQVLRGLSLSVERGGIVALLCSNGAGKSTVLKAVSRLLELEDGAVTAGTIRYDGADISALQPHQLVRRGLFHVSRNEPRSTCSW